MGFYKLSESRVRHVLHAPKRIEEGVAPRTVAMMYPAKSHEIWIMFQEKPGERVIISAWRYPGVTKPRSQVTLRMARQAYREFLDGHEDQIKLNKTK